MNYFMLGLKNNWIFLIVIGFLIFIILFHLTNKTNNHTINEIPDELLPSSNQENINHKEDIPSQTIIFVDIKGAVKYPGVYEVDPEKRVRDLIDLAGGFTNNADINSVNLAQKIYDEMVIFVPEEGQAVVQNEFIGSQKIEKIRVNNATEEEIAKLDGIGDVKAKAIVEFRDTYGYFKDINDLLSVSGIGEKTLEKIRDQIQVP
ncbi:competence protein ComEA [Aquibacillus albus]|uniref:Competence protein ComEA n=1 Tax=Aquibacillus albus TaxID=1168171 RepID=A0ABS2MUQ0_9BACI|nr:competence protein ComEA [Aquibacillus albus]